MQNLQELILEELFYENVRANLDLEKILDFDRDLRHSIDRALRTLTNSQEERQALAMEYMLRAWDRIGDEMSADAPDYIDIEPTEIIAEEATI